MNTRQDFEHFAAKLPPDAKSRGWLLEKAAQAAEQEQSPASVRRMHREVRRYNRAVMREYRRSEVGDE